MVELKNGRELRFVDHSYVKLLIRLMTMWNQSNGGVMCNIMIDFSAFRRERGLEPVKENGNGSMKPITL